MKKFILLTAIIFCCFKLGYSQSGQLDPSFGINGIVKTDIGFKITNTSYIRNLFFGANGRFYVLFDKDEHTYITRLLPDGSTDSTYAHGGFSSPISLYFSPNSTAVQPDGKILLLGEYGGDVAVARYNIDGNPDSTFSDDGLQTTDFNSYDDVGYGLTIQSDGKIAVVRVSSID